MEGQIPIQVKIQRFRPDVRIPAKAHEDDAAFDIYSSGMAAIPSHDVRVVPCAFSLEIPRGWEGQIRSRSGMAANGIIVANAPGTIDAGYRGEVKVILYNLGEKDYLIEPGERIAQITFKPAPAAEFVDMGQEEGLAQSARADGGLGSTGR